MQKFISKYALAAHLALLAVAPLFLFPYCTPSSIATVELYLTLFAAVWIVCEPSRRSGETMHAARTRVLSSIVGDALFWIMAVVSLIAALRWANCGVAMAFDLESETWSISSPRLAFIPGSVDGAGYLPFAVSVAGMILVAGCRHALGKSARICFLFTSSSLAGLSAIATAVLAYCGCPGAVVATKCSMLTASFVGSTFGLYLLASVAALPGIFEMRWNKLLVLFSLSIGGTATGLYFFAPAPVVALYAAAAALIMVCSTGYAGFVLSGNEAFKCVAAVIIAALIPVLCVMWFSNAEIDSARLDAIGAGIEGLFPERFVQARDILSSVAAKAWEGNSWLGTGLGSFPLDVRFHAAAEDWSTLVPGQAAALNGWWTLLAERGIIGAMVLAVVLAFLLWSFIIRLAGAFGRSCFVPACVLGPVALLALIAETFIDNSFLRPEALMAAAAFLALASASLPQWRQRKESQAEKDGIRKKGC